MEEPDIQQIALAWGKIWHYNFHNAGVIVLLRFSIGYFSAFVRSPLTANPILVPQGRKFL